MHAPWAELTGHVKVAQRRKPVMTPAENLRPPML